MSRITHHESRFTPFRLAPVIAAALALAVGWAQAAEGEPKKRSKAKAVERAEPGSLDERVAQARAIFVGEGMRIYFVDRQYREIAYIRAAGEGANRHAMIVVKVQKVLHAAGGEVPAQILVPVLTTRDVFGDGKSPYDQLVERHVGRQGIWMGEVVTLRDYGDDKSRKALENPVTILQVRQTDAKRRVNPVPLDVKRTKEVTDAIARVKGGAKPVAAPPAPPKDEG